MKPQNPHDPAHRDQPQRFGSPMDVHAGSAPVQASPYTDPANSNPYADNPYADNPYAAPQMVAPNPNWQAQANVGVWREGKVLVMHKQAILPDVCIKSNQKTDGFRLTRKLSWHHPAIALSLLLNLLVYVVLASVLSKRATIEIGLSDVWRKKRRLRMWIGWLSLLLGIAMFVAGIVLLDQREDIGFISFFAGIFIALFGGLYGLLSSRLVTPKKIDDHYVYLKGAHPEYLNQFPAIDQV